MLILDTSGSMLNATGSGPPSCGGTDTKLNHAKCAINQIANSYGEMVFALGRFRSVMGGTTTATTFPAGCCTAGPAVGANGSCAAGISCTNSDDELELLTGLIDGKNVLAATWTNGTGNTCDGTGTDPEIWNADSNTPLEGALNGAKDYWKGTQETDFTVWPAATAGFAPILNDPTKSSFLPAGCDASPTCTTNCCASQCRPYITILLTDGAETCGGNPAGTGVGADALFKTDIGNCKLTPFGTCYSNADCTGAGNSCINMKRYRIQTKPIGFGVTAPNTQIEGIAHAGGAPDVAGVNEGFYATDEASLEVALSTILAGTIKTEVCNHVDDNCNGLVDEGFNVGGACNNGQLGACRRTGTLDCTPDGSSVQCSAPTITPGTEICNGIDDDCDGSVDEGLTGCTCSPQGEICNNKDDDCDGSVDEGITRQCGTGTCLGIETCTAGAFGGCTARTPTTEICNKIDDDCDGVIDGITQDCSNLSNGFPATDPRNNPAGNPASGCVMEGPAVCACRVGTETCPANGNGTFSACTGEVVPTTEICNGIDDDCDGIVDEDTGGQDCSTGTATCGIGMTVCTAGVITCTTMASGTDDTCDGIDDDCDGTIDEGYVPVPCGTGVVCNGMSACVAGHVVCDGNPITTETCNCLDDDCDGSTDENVTCGAGATCTNCQCAFACGTGEFPCPAGKACVGGFCIADPCFNIDCPNVNGSKQVCVVQGNGHACVDACTQVTCTGGLVCKPDTGTCVANNCTSFPQQCTSAQNCINGMCTSNPCAGVNCPTDQYCVGVNGVGTCTNSCAGVDCGSGMRCELGACVPDPCGHCPAGLVCHDSTGQCQPDPCDQVLCPQGQWCDPHGDGTCSTDPCVGTSCPGTGQVCIGGTCDNPKQPTTPDGAAEEHVTTGGGGGCNTSGDGGLLVGLALIGLVATRRRRAAGGAA